MATHMASTGMTHEIEEIVSSIFENMLGLQTSLREVQVNRKAPTELHSSVQFTGRWRGVISIECTWLHARRFAARFLSLPAFEIDDQIACDVLGELTNMVAGNLKPLFASDIQCSVATVSSNKSKCALDFKPEICEELHFCCAEGNFVARVLAALAHE